MELATAVLIVILTALATAFVFTMIAYDELDDQYKERHKHEKAGHKAHFTRVKRNYEIAKKIIRKGRE